MVDRGCGLSLSRQCELLGVSRSAQYYEALGESAADLALMRRLDELHLEHPFYRSYRLPSRALPRTAATSSGRGGS